MSTETKALRIYEEKLLVLYQKYLQFLKDHSSFKGSSKCISSMLESLHHFNFKDQLFELALANLPHDPEILLSGVRSVLLSPELDTRHRMLLRIHNFIKKTSSKIIPPELIEILGEIKFTILTEEKLPKKRKREEVDRDIKEIEDDTNETAKKNREILQELLAVLFRILK